MATIPGTLPRKGLYVLVAVLFGAILVFANVHFVYVALSSQPDCVPHLKSSGEASGSFRAAKSSC